MRLLNVHNLSFHEFYDEAPPYVTASHRWQKEPEATMEDVLQKHNTNSAGFQKVMGFTQSVRNHVTGMDWVWIDTCCIDQRNNPEVSEAVISMFRWYNNAQVCLAYLQDVEDPTDFDAFRQSEWFKRGWTLQELLAPRLVIFLTRDWEIIGHKGDKQRKRIPTGPSLELHIAQATGIPAQVLSDYQQSYNFPIDDRLKWMEGRSTKRPEDTSYCLFGMFDVSIPVLYGEGKEKARQRLLDEIERQE
ncbi:hypothetical protein K431DRAFT_207095, partial [Polychaeton citri CBS 116435]